MESSYFTIVGGNVFYAPNEEKLEVKSRNNNVYDGISLISRNDKDPYLMSLKNGEKIINYTDGDYHHFITNFGNYCTCGDKFKRIFDIGVKPLGNDKLISLSNTHGQTSNYKLSMELFQLIGIQPADFISARNSMIGKETPKSSLSEQTVSISSFDRSIDERMDAQISSHAISITQIESDLAEFKKNTDERLSKLAGNVAQLSDMIFSLNDRIETSKRSGRCVIM